MVCSEKRQDGLGLRKLTLLNKGLLGKWIWRFASEKDCTWKNLINTKYGLEGLGWYSKDTRGPFGVGLWGRPLEGDYERVQLGKREWEIYRWQRH